MAKSVKQLEIDIANLQGMVDERNETIAYMEKAEKAGAPAKLLLDHKNQIAERDQRISDLESSQRLDHEAMTMIKGELDEALETIVGLRSGMAPGSGDELPLNDSELDDEFFRNNGVDLHVIPSESGVKRIQWGASQKLLRMVTLARDASGMGKPGAMVIRMVGIDGDADSQMSSSMEVDTKLSHKNGTWQLVRGR